jgi:signal transduction histidine kinase
MTELGNASEAQRLKELDGYHILDTLSQKEFDDITKMASLICDTPIALISLVSGERQWFKSRYGLGTPETPREYSFCSHAIQTQEKPFIITDSRKDLRFKDNPLVTGDPNIVFYAGIPLVNKNGYGLGTVCVIDSKPRELTEKQIEGLKILSSQVIHLLELHKVNQQLAIQAQGLHDHIELLDSQGQQLEYKLNQQISERFEEVSQQQQRLEKMNKELQAYAYISSHDLQEPLRKIQTFISLIAARELPNLSEKGKEYFSRINRASVRISSLIRDLCSYSASTNASGEFKKITLESVIDEVKDDLDDEIHKYKATLTLSNDVELHVIPSQFRQVIYNLVSNSMKFSKPEDRPQILIGCVCGEGSTFGIERLDQNRRYVKIQLQDNGIGFDNQYRERIFEFFQTLDSCEHVYGTGIGLAIVKKIVDNHSGFVVATSTLGNGAMFEIYLPETADIKRDAEQEKRQRAAAFA